MNTNVYGGYNAACKEYKLTHAYCMAHARRKFVEAQDAQPKGKVSKPDIALRNINKLYSIKGQILPKSLI
ncbi:IS66 family transposase [Vibrio penaeicida]|uniref:IS66 family transposase n=1 Tax=Vibrio penaeicida TaxID=104609 RepID=UPI000F8398E9|nr:transposase [Vibrio penaeicida]RTZ19024.1 hypothetical protein EKN09_28665 [Vibrio penaeicida]